MQARIEESAYRVARRHESGEMVVVGVNRFADEEADEPEPLAVDPALEERQIGELATRRAARDSAAVDETLAAVEESAKGEDNLLPPMKQALAAGATVGEVSDALRRVFGVHRPSG